MIDQKRIAYYERRYAEERKLADTAAYKGVAKIHAQLAACYARIVKAEKEPQEVAS